jgi:hypothetical protein
MQKSRKKRRSGIHFHQHSLFKISFALKEEILQLKRTAMRISRDVKKYWIKVSKIVQYKQKLEMEELRNKVCD